MGSPGFGLITTLSHHRVPRGRKGDRESVKRGTRERGGEKTAGGWSERTSVYVREEGDRAPHNGSNLKPKRSMAKKALGRRKL